MLEQYATDIKSNPRLLLQAIAEHGSMMDIAKLCDRLDGIDVDSAAQAASEQQFQRDTDLCERYESDQFCQNLGWERAA
jgi:hypothetical protein